MKTKKIVISALLITLIGAGAVKLKDVLMTNSTVGTDNSTDNQDSIGVQKDYQKLAVLADRCRGCGKCTRIDPEHFELNRNTRKAMVISATNLDSANLSMAINNCPDRAITLN
ncbi:MAG: ferredoxin [Candidatus Shapirobacteria bacterium]